MTDALWQLGGWTMLHFLWAGTVAGLMGGLIRLACRRAAPSVRYALSLATLAVLAALPIAIAALLALHRPAILVGRAAAISSEPEMPKEGPSQDASARYAAAEPLVIDLATAPPPVLKEPVGASSQPQRDASSDRMASPSPSRSAGTTALRSVATGDRARLLPSLRGRGIAAADFVPYLPYAWLVGTPLTFALLATGLVGSERLRRRSSLLTAGPAFEACERLRKAMRIARRVSVAACEGLAQPVLVGVVRPLILLPASALSGWTPEELEMVLVHELAHVRRWDNLVNLLQRIVESLLFFHPAVWLVSGALRRDREECCDAVVVSRTAQPQRYAELLLSIAAVLPRGQAPRLATASAMADHPLTGRIRRILKLEDEPMWISRRTLLFSLMLPLAVLAATVFTAAGDESNKASAPNTASLEDDEISQTSQDVTTPPSREGAESIPLTNKGETLQGHVEERIYPPNARQSEIDKFIDEQESQGGEIKVFHRNDGATVVTSVIYNEGWRKPNNVTESPSLSSDPQRIDEKKERDALEQEIRALNSRLDRLRSLRDGLLDENVSVSLDALPLIEGDAKAPPYKEAEQQFTSLQQELKEVARDLTPDSRRVQELARQLRDARKTLKKVRQESIDYWQERLKEEPDYMLEKVVATNADLRSSILEKERKMDRIKQSLNAQNVPTAEPSAAKVSWHTSFEKAKAEAERVGKPLLLYFKKANDPACRRFEQDVLANSEVQALIAEKFVAVSVDVKVSASVAAIYGVQQVPEVAVATSNAKPLGFVSKEGPIIFRGGLMNGYQAAEREDASQNNAAKPAGKEGLQPGDEVKIEVVGAFPEAPINGVFVIEPQGTVALGATYGRVKIAGMSLIEAEKAVTEKLHAVLSDPQVQITLPPTALRRGQSTESQSPQAGSPAWFWDAAKPKAADITYLYDGKTFEEWRSLWKNELNPIRRAEAISAMAAFSRTGYGKEATVAILDVADQYDFNSYDQSPEGQLKQRVLDVLTNATSRVSEANWLPELMERLRADREKWTPLTGMLLSQLHQANPGGVRDAGARRLLFELASDPKFKWWHEALRVLLLGGDDVPLTPEVERFVKEALTGKDKDRAIHVLVSMNFQRLDAIPEQVDLLFDEEVRRAARGILPNLSAAARSRLAERLLAVLDDEERSRHHADAVRALGVLMDEYNQFQEGLTKPNWERSKEFSQITDRLFKLIREGPEEIVPTALVAMGLDSVERVDEWLKGTGPSQPEDVQERVMRARDKIDAEAKGVMDDAKNRGVGGGFF
jgi:beta-lactamase regulating signal transducer with metallopeptidase domain